VPKKVERIVVLQMPFPSIIYALDGSGKRVVGMHPTAKKALEEGILAELAPEYKEVSTAFVKEGFKVNIEELIKLKPDVVFQWDTEPEEIDKIERAGIPVVALHVRGTTLEDVEGWSYNGQDIRSRGSGPTVHRLSSPGIRRDKG